MSTQASHDSAAIRTLVLSAMPDSARGEANPALFGRGGCFDSLGLVNFLADLEYLLAQQYERELVLASERAMSLRRSPFRDVDSLVAYIGELLTEPRA